MKKLRRATQTRATLLAALLFGAPLPIAAQPSPCPSPCPTSPSPVSVSPSPSSVSPCPCPSPVSVPVSPSVSPSSVPVSVPPSPSSSPDPPAPSRPLTTAEVLASTNDADWRNLDPEHTVYVDLPSGRVVIELAPAFAPRHVANIRTLVRGHYFDGLAVVRSQDNYVVQWGDPAAEKEPRRPLPATAAASLAPELDRTIGTDLSFTRLPDGDVYAPVAGFSQGFPVAVDDVRKKIGLTHCYGMVGVGRGEAADSGNGAELYVVIGHSPRHLDRNVTLVGRVVQGMDRLSTLPRGSGPFGFYEDRAQRVPLKQVRLGAELPESERSHIQSLRTDTEAFRNLIEARRTRRESWFLDPVGKVELCNVPLPVREAKVGPTRRP